jgi:hypothetical protein
MGLKAGSSTGLRSYGGGRVGVFGRRQRKKKKKKEICFKEREKWRMNKQASRAQLLQGGIHGLLGYALVYIARSCVAFGFRN